MFALALSQFVNGSHLVARHHVVVLGEEGDFALILPTVSIDAAARHAQVAGEVSAKDRALAGWANRCKFVPAALQWVPRSWITVRPDARFSRNTRTELEAAALAYGPRAPRHSDDEANQLTFVPVRQDKQRIPG